MLAEHILEVPSKKCVYCSACPWFLPCPADTSWTGTRLQALASRGKEQPNAHDVLNRDKTHTEYILDPIAFVIYERRSGVTDTPALSHLGRCHKFSNPHAAEGHLHLEPAIVHSNVLCVWTTPYNSPLSTNPPGCSILDFDHDAGQTAGASVGCISLVIAESSFLEKAWYSSEFPIQMYVCTNPWPPALHRWV